MPLKLPSVTERPSELSMRSFEPVALVGVLLRVAVVAVWATMNDPPGIPDPLMPWLMSAVVKCPAEAVIVFPETAAVVVT